MGCIFPENKLGVLQVGGREWRAAGWEENTPGFPYFFWGGRGNVGMGMGSRVWHSGSHTTLPPSSLPSRLANRSAAPVLPTLFTGGETESGAALQRDKPGVALMSLPCTGTSAEAVLVHGRGVTV